MTKTDGIFFTPSSLLKNLRQTTLGSATENDNNDDESINDETKNSSDDLGEPLPIDLPLNDLALLNEEDIRNPSLFSELYSMAYVSAAIFALADVRSAAREGIIKVSDECSIQNLPVTTEDIIDVFGANEEQLKLILKEDDFSLLKKLSERTEMLRNKNTPDKPNALTMVLECTLDHFGDDNVARDCVYLIFKNDLNKRITLCFRGSITLQDWIKDSKVFVDNIPNPVADRHGQAPTIGVHQGFKEYLYGTSTSSSFGSLMESSSKREPDSAPCSVRDADESRTNINSWKFNSIASAFLKWKEKVSKSEVDIGGSVNKDITYAKTSDSNDVDDGQRNDHGDMTGKVEKEKYNNDIGDNDENPRNADPSEMPGNTENPNEDVAFPPVHNCRLDKILDELERLRKSYNDYSIYITGHSLGGALGLLTALEAGSRFGEKHLPVTYVGIANPRGGTEGFRDAVSVLEKEGKLRCVCVHGVHDIVPMIPASSLNRATKKRFCQSGIQMLLEKDKLEIRYSPKPDDNYNKRVRKALSSAHKIKERHHYITYLNELRGFSKALRELHINDYYNMIYESEIFVPSERKSTPMEIKVNTDCDA
ncbi:unnamed protein product [Pseudo-nitzschia multistriata]|uniref:Fungal lipase-type domain-containing protein n=1 Tax=Pseudo-nitzschia multistriata TaxID=183589 RepID=A0A448ZMV8_9STRA|nr:unnamed protein product [Pseudo-nitzschia multistriata]